MIRFFRLIPRMGAKSSRGSLEPGGSTCSRSAGLLIGKAQYESRQEVVAELTWNFPYAPVDLTLSVARAGLHGGQTYFRPGCPVDLRVKLKFCLKRGAFNDRPGG